jgi:hypothetical protein
MKGQCDNVIVALDLVTENVYKSKIKSTYAKFFTMIQLIQKSISALFFATSY